MFNPVQLLIAVTVACLIVAAYMDIKLRKVPDIIPALLLVSAFVFQKNPVIVFIGFVLTFAFGFYLFVMKAWGGADAKLSAGMGAVIGLTQGLAWFVVFMAFFGTIYIWVFRKFSQGEYKKHTPFVPVFLVSYLLLIITYQYSIL